jgi:ribonuclease HI
MDTIDETAINIYTDGSSYSHPRAGGIGIRIITVDANGNEVIHDEQPLGFPGATNQQMELQACIEALQLLASRRSPVDLSQFSKIIIKTDSRYVVDNYSAALFTWPTTKWHTRDGAPVINAQLWKDLVKQVFNVGMRVEIRWVKGHRASAHNKAADKLAKGSAKQAGRKPLTITSVRRKKTAKSIERGSVKLTGQRITIRIITDEYLRVQRCYKVKYEVMSKASVYFGNVDIAFSDIVLRAGHTYYVLMNDDTANPRIMKLYREAA